jgi:hypothetical protein
MELIKNKKHKKGQPNGRIHVALQEGLYGTTSKGKSVSFTVYNTSLRKLSKFIKTKIKEEQERKQDM